MRYIELFKKYQALIYLWLSVFSGQSLADYTLYSGNSWLVFCQKYEEQEKSIDNLCEMLTLGLVQGAMYGHSYNTKGWPYCISESQSNSQHIRVIKKYLDNHPERSDIGAGGITILAMKSAFPCK